MFRFILYGELILLIPSGCLADYEWLSDKLKVLNKGTALASQKHQKLVPEHAFALSVHLNKNNLDTIELDKEQALAYLRKRISHS